MAPGSDAPRQRWVGDSRPKPAQDSTKERNAMTHHDQAWDPGHGELGHVHDETWNRHMMETDDPATWKDDRTTTDHREGGKEAVGAGAGALGGAAVGMAVGGPPGAVVGGAVGALGGAVAGEASEGNDEAGAGAGGVTGGLAGAAVGGAVGGPPGAVVGGAVGAAGGAGLGDKAEDKAQKRDTADYVDPRRV
jgi:hypothetical protein